MQTVFGVLGDRHARDSPMVFCAKSLKTFVQPRPLRFVAAIITLQLMVQGVNAMPFFLFYL